LLQLNTTAANGPNKLAITVCVPIETLRLPFLALSCDQLSLRVITARRKDWHSAAIGAVLSSDLGATGASEILPRRLYRRCGASAVRRDAVMNRMEDLMSKSAKKPSPAKSPLSARSVKPSRQIAAEPKTNQADAGSKQARVIAMLQSPTGTTIAAIMKATGWQRHSVRGFLAGVVRKRLELKLASKKVNGNRIYQIASEESGKVSKVA
jgi:hypothetical protein